MEKPAARARARSRAVSATPPGSSGKPRSLSTLSGSGVAAATSETCLTSSSRVTCMSRFPSVHAKPALVVASASKPSDASSFAEPTSHGLGMTKTPSRSCSSRKVATSCNLTAARLLLPHRQCQHERRPGAGIGADLERAAVRLRDRPRDEETEAGPRLRSPGDVGAAELLEDEARLVAREARAAIDDRDPRDAVLRAYRQLDLVVAGRVLHRIVDEVRQHLAQPLAVPPDRGHGAAHRRAHSHLVLP